MRNKIMGFAPRARVWRLFTVATCVLVNACGGDHAATVNAAAGLPTSATISTSPALDPAFDPLIHDYVLRCNNTSEVQLTADLAGGDDFAFGGPGVQPVLSDAAKSGHFQTSLALKAGQRFQFAIGSLAATYSVRCLPPDFPPLTAAAAGDREAEWYVFSPTLYFALDAGYAASPYVVIADSNGTPVWWMSEPKGQALDAKVLSGSQIVWTIQTNEPDGQYFIRNFAGTLIKTIGSDLNDHDLQPTATGTFLAIRDMTRVCPTDCADMSPWGGSPQTAAIDQEIVELDQNSNVLWTWRTRDHISLAETGLAGFFPAVGSDIIHMNAVEPDGSGGVLFSARHLSAIYHITKSTGAIDWKIGGVTRAESLVVVGDSRPSTVVSGHPLSGQHDVRLYPDGTVSVHDNGTLESRPPAIIRFQLDTAARIATVVELIEDKLDASSACCGSARRLSGGHWLVQWGGLPYFSELASNGDPVLTVNYNSGGQFSYRAVPVVPGSLDAKVLRAGMDAMAKR